MSRIWREGQQRCTFVYRLVLPGTIEDAMLRRQNSKGDLADLLENSHTGGSDDASHSVGTYSSRRQSLTQKDVMTLLYPNGGCSLSQSTQSRSASTLSEVSHTYFIVQHHPSPTLSTISFIHCNNSQSK